MEVEKSIACSVTSINEFISCPRKYFFSHVLPSNTVNSSAIRKQAFWLKKSVNLDMWAGNLVDMAMNKFVIPVYQEKKNPDFKVVFQQVLEVAREQYTFSKSQLYKQQNESKAGEKYCVMQIHENQEPYEEIQFKNAIEKVKIAIENIPKIKFTDGKLLTDFLMEAKWLAPDERRRHLKIGNADINPQIDLIMSHETRQIVIDWKVADSKNSNYERQLLFSGTVIYRKRLEKSREDGWAWDFHQIGLYEVNLYKATIKEHKFSEEKYHETVDLISESADRLKTFFRGRKPIEIPIEDYGFYRKASTCDTCAFKHLCNYTLLNNDFQPKHYREFVRMAQSA